MMLNQNLQNRDNVSSNMQDTYKHKNTKLNHQNQDNSSNKIKEKNDLLKADMRFRSKSKLALGRIDNQQEHNVSNEKKVNLEEATKTTNNIIHSDNISMRRFEGIPYGNEVRLSNCRNDLDMVSLKGRKNMQKPRDSRSNTKYNMQGKKPSFNKFA